MEANKNERKELTYKVKEKWVLAQLLTGPGLHIIRVSVRSCCLEKLKI